MSPPENVGFDPHSEEYFQKLIAALDLDTDTYSHVDQVIMKQCKELIRKYSQTFIYQVYSWVQSKTITTILQQGIPLLFSLTL